MSKLLINLIQNLLNLLEKMPEKRIFHFLKTLIVTSLGFRQYEDDKEHAQQRHSREQEIADSVPSSSLHNHVVLIWI